jgi:hypothetical protein
MGKYPDQVTSRQRTSLQTRQKYWRQEHLDQLEALEAKKMNVSIFEEALHVVSLIESATEMPARVSKE